MRRGWRAFARHRLGTAGAAITLALALLAAVAPRVARHDPMEVRVLDSLQPPSKAHWFGTDQFGRDVWARIMYGARLSFVVGFLSMALASAVGIPLGVLAGYLGGRLDAVVMRLLDAVLAFPAILLAIGLVAGLGPGRWSGILAIGIVNVPVLARVARGAVLVRRDEEYVEAARAIGSTDWTILRHHIVPNSLAPLLVQVTLGFASAIVIEASLSFLGAGMPPPTPSWGSMLNEARPFMIPAPHVAVFPGAAISLAVLGLNLLGDGLRDALDPRLSE
jgi:peptide/nickel transport system permease protein